MEAETGALEPLSQASLMNTVQSEQQRDPASSKVEGKGQH